MTSATPDTIASYLRAADTGDVDTLVASFTEDAEVVDEGQTWRGRSEIRRWRESLASQYEYTVEVLGTKAVDQDHYVVTTRLEGNFPGGTVDLAYRFTLRDGRIAELSIAPAA